MASIMSLLALVAVAAPSVEAQAGLTEEVLAVVMYTMYGDSTPYALGTPELTTLGAQQLYTAGSNMRSRYVTETAETGYNSSSIIRGISPYQLSNEDLSIMALDQDSIAASAQAFMQGLYPPLGLSNSTSTHDLLANGSTLQAPLNGIQYPTIDTLSSNDLNSIWLAGSSNCPSYASVSAEYYESSTFQTIEATTQEFYETLVPQYLNGLFTNSSVGYYDAFYIWDYLNYAYNHNSTVADSLSIEDLEEAKLLATDWVFAMSGNTTVSGTTQGDQIGVVAGKTLAARVMEAFYTTINTQGLYSKMTLMFGSFEPMVAFSALANMISEVNPTFTVLPPEASSFVFELVALISGDDDGSYPDSSNLFVRFLYQNGTGPYSQLVPYPMFGNSPSNMRMSLDDFTASMEDIMIYNIETWCQSCQSDSIFCPAFTQTDNNNNNDSSSNNGHHLNSVVAGVIGALVALAVAALIFIALMLIGGFRVRKVHTKRRSELGGFKGAERLASDQDLTIPKGGAGAVVTDAVASPTRGHERVGSWELRDQAKAEEAQMAGLPTAVPKARRPSYEDDELNTNPYSKPVNPHNHV